jgi:anti-sigma regulatory factor (Ser/Thr protein kinase)
MSRESSLAAAHVVTLLRSFYRRDADESHEAVDINKLAAATVSITRPRWFDMPQQHGLAVEVVQEFDDVGCVQGNAAELRDALTNLLFNAVDALPQGGEIFVRTHRDGDEIVLEVADTGTGMPDDVREKCLEPYFTTKGVQGSGLGLSMVMAIADRHRGRLSIASQVGKGTTICLHRPAAKVAAATTAVAALPDERATCRVLCVDDDPRVLRAVEGMLRQLGHQVTACESGADALERIGRGSFDVLRWPAVRSSYRRTLESCCSPAGRTGSRSKATCRKVWTNSWASR